MANIAYLRSMLEKARRQGDLGTMRAIKADLRRYGYADDDPRTRADGGLETAVPGPMEQAVPKSKGGRPRKPRCEHNKIIGRCLDCEADDDGPVAA